MRKIHFILFIHLIGRSLYSQVQPELDWYKIYNGPGNSYDFSHDIQIIGSEIYVAGGSYMPDGFADAFFIKYSNEGDSLLSFYYSLRPNVRDEYNSFAVDENSDIYFTGVTTIGNEKRLIFQKFNSLCGNLWTKDFNFKALGLKVIMDKNNFPVLAYVNYEGPYYTHLVISSFSPSGDSLWSAVFRSDTTAYSIIDLLIDDGNFIYVSIIQLQVKQGESFYYSSVACVKDGIVIWHKYLQGSHNRGVVFDNEYNLIAITQDDSRIYKINRFNGEIIWEKNINDSSYHINYLDNVCVDEQNNIVVAGYDSTFNSGIQVKKLSSSGEELWLRNYNTPENLGDFPFGLFIDKTGDIYIAVRSEDSLRYSKGSVIKFSKNGDLEWEYFFDELDYEYSVFRPFYIDDNLNLYLNGSFSDSNSGSNIFIMKLSQKNNTGINEPLSISRSYSLLQNYPNPFNPYTDINFSLPVSSFIKLTINDITGQQIKSLINEEKRSGNYSVKWDGKDDSGSLVSSGVYFYRIQANDFIMVKKMILLR